jgi:glucose/arabinose dehydrogenase
MFFVMGYIFININKTYYMKKILFLFSLVSLTTTAQIVDADFTVTNVATKLHVPWEILWGPDDKIWFTERSGQGQSTTQPGTNGKVKRVDPETGTIETLLTITDSYETQESGVLGMAIHPDFKTTKPWVYVVYTYQKTSATNGIVEKLVRYTYQNNQLVSPVILLDDILGNTTHVGSRLFFLPDKTLLMSTGEAQNQPLAQDKNSKNGKILRMNDDGSVPADNPISGSLMYSFGHRNPQGITYGNGKIYSSEHGANDNDEINIIEPGKNYGWPSVRGYCDNQDATETNFCNANTVTPPIWSSGNTATEATAGIDYYPANGAVSVLQNSLLMVSLKIGTTRGRDLRIYKLSANGSTIASETILFNNVYGRMRDICVSPTGDIYISTSNYDGRYGSNSIPATDDRIIKLKYTKKITGEEESNENEALKIHPNPVGDVLNLNYPNNEKVSLVNTDGSGRFDFFVTNSRINVSNLLPGVYIIMNSKNTVVGKIVKL